MRYEALVGAALAGYSAAHALPGSGGGRSAQFLGGRRALAELGLRLPPSSARRSAPVSRSEAVVDKRQADPDQCGPGVGSCADSKCCSPAGWCGTGTEYCAAPDCQQNYGPACDANQKPTGADTSAVPRPKVGSVTYNGAGLYSCANAGEIAITFDDGPSQYTSELLDKLDAYNAKATFFVTGNNLGKGQINDPSTPYPAILKRMDDSGHQIASHTWSHQNSSQTTAEQWTEQIVWNEIAINDVLGFWPAYFRPPYSICESQCQTIMSDLGYHIVYFDLDTEGYLHNDPVAIQQSKNIVDNAIASSDPAADSWLNIEHDIQQYIVEDLVDYMLEHLSAAGWTFVTVGDCLNDPKENWYRTLDDQGATGSGDGDGDGSGSGDVVSTDGSCGDGTTCLGSQFGDCCSQYGWCGSTDAYCAAGCNNAWGSCSGTTTPEVPATVSTDGSCGGSDEITCLGSEFGDCCSQYGWCGQTTDYCSTGCQSAFGSCT